MMAPVGDQILRIIGREPAAQGIIEAAAMPAAIAALEQASRPPSRAARARAQADDDDEAPAAPTPSACGQRAWPMLEMMRRSLAERPTSSGASEPARPVGHAGRHATRSTS